MVLDDVWPGAEFFLQNFQINIPNYKILVTSRSDFPSFGFNYHLRPLTDEDSTALQVQWASQPDNVSRAEYEDLLQKLSLINEQQEKEEKRKYKAEAHRFTTIKVARDVDFTEQIGNSLYFDLVDHEKVWSFRIQKQTPFHLFKEEVAKDLRVPVQLQRFWIWAKRQNNTYRPHRPLLPTEELLTVEQIREISIKANNADALKLYLEVEYGPNYRPILLPGKSSEDILLFFKLL